jgi:HlyD family secretion protein
MRARLLVLLVFALVLAGAVVAWRLAHARRAEQELVLYGNVDLRQVLLSFNNEERIAEVRVQEGDRVAPGDVLARVDTSRLEPRVAQAEAQADAQRHAVERLHNGSRPEEIAQARANVESATADATNAKRQHERLKAASEGSGGGAVSDQDLANAQTALEGASARLAVAGKSLELALAGPRKEDVLEAESRLRAAEAELALLRRTLADADLRAPCVGVVRTRLLEPGEMAAPQRPVLSLAVVDPKWVRAYVSEPDLVRVRAGARAAVAVDGFPGREFEGWVGFLSPVAEFTPKAVQTEELRTSLVYEVRVFVKDPGNDLRLGMPATVRLRLDGGSAPDIATDKANR